jgi:peptidoglycan hydrolase CwlO-like protein
LDMGRIVQNSDVLLGIITQQVRSKRIWQIAATCLMIFAVIISFICLGLYMERENHIERVNQAEVTIQKARILEKQSIKSNKELEHIQDELTNSKAELKRAQGDLENSKSEVENLQSQLTDTRQRFKALQNRNAEAVERLNERLRKLSD